MYVLTGSRWRADDDGLMVKNSAQNWEAHSTSAMAEYGLSKIVSEMGNPIKILRAHEKDFGVSNR
jgi:hypothetical protein